MRHISTPPSRSAAARHDPSPTHTTPPLPAAQAFARTLELMNVTEPELLTHHAPLAALMLYHLSPATEDLANLTTTLGNATLNGTLPTVLLNKSLDISYE
jgi:hypothetical protein